MWAGGHIWHRRGSFSVGAKRRYGTDGDHHRYELLLVHSREIDVSPLNSVCGLQHLVLLQLTGYGTAVHAADLGVLKSSILPSASNGSKGYIAVEQVLRLSSRM